MKSRFEVLNDAEAMLIDLVAKVAPWCAPLPTAYLVGRATMLHLHWPIVIGIAAASVVESLGLVTTATALDLYQYNRSKRKVDPAAPFVLAVSLVSLYFAVATGLTVFLDIYPSMETYAPGIFPALSLVGVTVIALRNDHRKQLQAIQSEHEERRAERLALKQARSAKRLPSNFASTTGSLDTVQERLLEARRIKMESRQEALLKKLVDQPKISVTEIAHSMGWSRQTVYSYLASLEKQGRLRRNGHGVEVVQ